MLSIMYRDWLTNYKGLMQLGHNVMQRLLTGTTGNFLASSAIVIPFAQCGFQRKNETLRGPLIIHRLVLTRCEVDSGKQN